MRIIAMGGEPASGKTVVFKRFKKGKKTKRFKHGQLRGEIDKKNKLIYLGVYESKIGEDSFCGTDRLSMSVQPDALAFVKKASKKYEGYTLLFEGDRLFNQKFLNAVRRYGLVTIVLDVDSKTLNKRHKEREGDNQSATFLKGRKTKIRNIVADNDIILMKHNSTGDTKKIVSLLKKIVNVDPIDFQMDIGSKMASKEERRSFGIDNKHKFW